VHTTPAERLIVVANQLKGRSMDGTTVVMPLETSAQLRATLEQHLGIALPAGYALPDPPAPPPGLREI